MTSAKLIRAAQTNGKKSYGPRSAKGKRRSAANSLQHGLYAKQLPFDSQCQSLAQTLRHAYTNEFHPQSAHESHLITAIAQAEAQHHWAERIAAQILDAALARSALTLPAPGTKPNPSNTASGDNPSTPEPRSRNRRNEPNPLAQPKPR